MEKQIKSSRGSVQGEAELGKAVRVGVSSRLTRGEEDALIFELV